MAITQTKFSDGSRGTTPGECLSDLRSRCSPFSGPSPLCDHSQSSQRSSQTTSSLTKYMEWSPFGDCEGTWTRPIEELDEVRPSGQTSGPRSRPSSISSQQEAGPLLMKTSTRPKERSTTIRHKPAKPQSTHMASAQDSQIRGGHAVFGVQVFFLKRTADGSCALVLHRYARLRAALGA